MLSILVNRRSRFEIYMDIMNALADGPKNPTRLMYTTNLSWAPLQECLKALIAQGAVAESEQGSKRKAYALTHKGISIISRYREFVTELTSLSNSSVSIEQENDVAILH